MFHVNLQGCPLEWKKQAHRWQEMEIRIDSVEGFGGAHGVVLVPMGWVGKTPGRVELQNHQLDRHPTAKIWCLYIRYTYIIYI